MAVAVMTVHLSPHKVSKILRGYFRGLPQTNIAWEARVDQSSVSHYASRFKETVNKYGLSAAGEEYRVLNEVESLRSLSVELYQSKLTIEDARQGHDIIKAFLKLGINPEQHINLVEVCKKVEDPGFIDAAVKLSQIEAQTGMDYHQVVSDFEKAQKQLTQLEEKINKAKEEIKFLNNVILKDKNELAVKEEYLKKRENEVKAQEAQLEKELSAKIKQLEVDKKEVDEVAILKADLAKKNLSIETVIKVAEEF
jgi:predicted O-linked N-acetylglucosamine transferase (SPINDLY family)